MFEQKPKATLLVDGAFLKQCLQQIGKKHSPQEVKRCLYHMVQVIQQEFPNLDLSVNYYGVRAGKNIFCPISNQVYKETGLSDLCFEDGIPGVRLKTLWGRQHCPFEKMWIMKPESYKKATLTDADFVLNEQPKGVLAQLVDTMAEKAVRQDDSCLFVFGDARDMAYALETTRSMNMPVYEMTFEKGVPVVSSHQETAPFKVFDVDILGEVSEVLSQTCAADEAAESTLAKLRALDVDRGQRMALLMLDVGGLRKYLSNENKCVSAKNIQILMKQIEDKLPDALSKIILYHATMPSKIVNPKVFRGCEYDDDLEIPTMKDPHIMLSLGKVLQSAEYPSILKQEKWQTPHAKRLPTDFIANVRQYDVDDRVVYDLALARFNPNIGQIYLLSSDGDFATVVKKAQEAGLDVTLVRLEDGTKSLSSRLEHSAGGVIQLMINLDELELPLSRKEIIHQKNEKEKHCRLKEKKAQKKLAARLEAEDAEDAYSCFVSAKPDKQERWGCANMAYKKLRRKVMYKNRYH